ncbi:VOC family protein [Fangia hongkongensis]|uniref:VOC family protein n=1 Tax=Fangia hongkongensis TaxID=270495 RepID=UPI00035E2B7A|nr:VOC family protein [Fangia hongkongensis]MBK2125733.1 VOC family protein [Fangia hongkongensis]
MIKFSGLSHINIVVDDTELASQYYKKLFNAEPLQTFPHFKNVGFSKSAGFMDNPEKVDVTVRFLQIPDTNLTLELMQYHAPKPIDKRDLNKKTHQIGNVGHIALKVNNIEESFNYIKSSRLATLISSRQNYDAYQIDAITTNDFYFHDEKMESDLSQKDSVCNIVGNIKYFYFVDNYGIQWELEQGHADIGE